MPHTDLYCDTDSLAECREARALRIENFIHEQNAPVIQMLLNIPGPYKRSNLTDYFFKLLFEQFMNYLKAEQIKLRAHYLYSFKTGIEAYFILDVKQVFSSEIKEKLIEFENGKIAVWENCPGKAYRLLDLDLYVPAARQENHLHYRKITRQEISDNELRPRQCFLCEREAFFCARSRRHSLEELADEIEHWLREFIFSALAKKVIDAAANAILSEIMITPKPGLVDLQNHGSHTDMSRFTFIKSSVCLLAYFRECFYLGRKGQNIEVLFKQLRRAGRYAEVQMLKATDQINTQKGIIFSFGLLLGAYGCLLQQKLTAETLQVKSMVNLLPDAEEIKNITAKWGSLAMQDLQILAEQKNQAAQNLTNGEKLFLQFQIKGARGLAESGYAICFAAQKILRDRLREHWDFNDAGLYTWLFLANQLQDTTFLSRAIRYDQLETAKQIQSRLALIMQKPLTPGLMKYELEQLDELISAHQLTFGGIADALACTLFLWNLENIHSEMSELFALFG